MTNDDEPTDKKYLNEKSEQLGRSARTTKTALTPSSSSCVPPLLHTVTSTNVPSYYESINLSIYFSLSRKIHQHKCGTFSSLLPANQFPFSASYSLSLPHAIQTIKTTNNLKINDSTGKTIFRMNCTIIPSSILIFLPQFLFAAAAVGPK